MPTTPLSARAGAIPSLLRPIQKVLDQLLPDFLEKAVDTRRLAASGCSPSPST